jgi:hypothetical protein
MALGFVKHAALYILWVIPVNDTMIGELEGILKDAVETNRDYNFWRN